MLASQAPYVDGLKTAGPTIILYLHSGEMLQYGSHLMRHRRLQGQVNLLRCRYDRPHLDSEYRCRRQCIHLLGFKAHGSGYNR